MSDKLHIHEDIELLKPLMSAGFYRDDFVYIMQEDRIIFIGTRESAKMVVAHFSGGKRKQLPFIKRVIL